MLTFRVTYSRNGQVFKEDVIADSYKIESSKHVTLFRDEHAIATFIDVDNVMAITPPGKVKANKKVENDLDSLLEKNPSSPFVEEEDDDDLQRFLGI